ncbi:hypothetical protein CVT26_005852 [Gymnopilus dilepis]|uniref:F-box domain-containing protein n=1 Tax=Gymnopilus dilepis TaxID=231916 RepID=A0A409WBU1_9AGAR|nr:hypothetical protein CVT26_005852 [Gymnopilus dilepis]
MPSGPPSYDSLFGSYSGSLSSHPQGHSSITANAFQIRTPQRIIDPLTLLPDDVVGQIFVQACQPILDIHSVDQWQREFYPLWLGQISRAWRQSAWTYSELWTYIVIRIAGFSDGIRDQLSILEEWIERANGRPLNIYVEQTNSPRHGLEGRALELSMDVLAMLGRHSNQWRRFDMHLPYKLVSSFKRPLRPVRRGSLPPLPEHPLQDLSLPLLQYAAIHIPIKHSDIRNPLLKIDFKEAPLLRTLSITQFFEEALFSCCPTQQITDLYLTSCSVDLTGFFRQFPRLKKLTWIKTNVQAVPRQPLTNDRLESFDVDIESLPRFLLHFLNFPALKNLSIRARKSFQYSQTLGTFLLSGCNLTSLTLECRVDMEHDLIELLLSNSLSSSLQELYIRHVPSERDAEHTEYGLTRTFFELLHPDMDPNYLTCLRVLEYEGPLAVQAIDFIEPLLIRSRIRVVDIPRSMTDGMAVLRRAKIKADQYSAVSEFSIAEYTDAQYVWEVMRALEEGVLALSNMDGTMWE